MLLPSLLVALAAPPATVLEHHLDVRVDWGQRLTTTQTWKVRIDDPAACVAGLLAPPGLDGAMDGGAMVLQELLVVPEQTVSGETFTLQTVTRGPRGAHSGVFQTAPGLPVEQASVSVTALGQQPLTVWADPLADPLWSTRGGKRAEVTWQALEAQETGRLVWSTWSDWMEAGDDLERKSAALLASKRALGRDLAGDLEASNLSEIVRRTLAHVEIDPSLPTSLDDARPADEVARSRRGSIVERMAVLQSMLTAAGYQVRPARLRKASTEGTFPVTVPSPDMVPTPILQVLDRAGQDVWIDPASDSVAVPALPSVMVGATVWVPGELPSQRFPPGVVDGIVSLTTQARVEANGDVRWTTDIKADGTALEAIRRLLRPLDANGQEKALRRLVLQGRPELERFTVQSSGTVDPFKPLTLTVSGQDTGTFTPHGPGLRGTFVPPLSVAMAAWLPPNIRVYELIDLAPPSGRSFAGHGQPGGAFDPSAQLDRHVDIEGDRVRIHVDAIRPYATASTAQDAAASLFLEKEARVGIDLLAYPPMTGSVAKSIGRLDAPATERAALQALLWWSVQDDKRARKVLKKALKTEDASLLMEALGAWGDAREERPWRALGDLLPPDAHDEHMALLRVVEQRNPVLALELARRWMQHSDPAVAVPALLIGMAHAPDQSLRNSLAARRPNLSGALAQSAALAVAEYDVDFGQDAAVATEYLAADSPRAQLVTLAAVAADLPRSELRDRVQSIRLAAPDDAAVAERAARTLARGGFLEEAYDAALDAARRVNDSPNLWRLVAERGMAAGNLQAALDAMGRAFDLAPEDPELTEHLHHVAVLARHEASEEAARAARPTLVKPTWPPTLDDLMGVARQEELLAVLRFHDAEVLASPIYLALRTQLLRDAGANDDAARDALDLSRLHDAPQGRALAFAATAGRVFGTGALQLLDDVEDPTAHLTRLDYRVITTSGDARADARALRDEPRAQDILLAIGSPREAAAAVDGWPTDLADPRPRPPRGYRTNPILSAAKGVTAFSHVDRQLALLYIASDTTVLPPPLASLYSTSGPALGLTPEGDTLLALRDGYLPLYAARRVVDGQTLLGLGFTPEAARRALRDAR